MSTPAKGSYIKDESDGKIRAVLSVIAGAFTADGGDEDKQFKVEDGGYQPIILKWDTPGDPWEKMRKTWDHIQNEVGDFGHGHRRSQTKILTVWDGKEDRKVTVSREGPKYTFQCTGWIPSPITGTVEAMKIFLEEHFHEMDDEADEEVDEKPSGTSLTVLEWLLYAIDSGRTKKPEIVKFVEEKYGEFKKEKYFGPKAIQDNGEDLYDSDGGFGDKAIHKLTDKGCAAVIEIKKKQPVPRGAGVGIDSGAGGGGGGSGGSGGSDDDKGTGRYVMCSGTGQANTKKGSDGYTLFTFDRSSKEYTEEADRGRGEKWILKRFETEAAVRQAIFETQDATAYFVEPELTKKESGKKVSKRSMENTWISQEDASAAVEGESKEAEFKQLYHDKFTAWMSTIDLSTIADETISAKRAEIKLEAETEVKQQPSELRLAYDEIQAAMDKFTTILDKVKKLKTEA